MGAKISVSGEASDGTKTLTLAEQLLPDVLLIDMRMPELDGIEICRRLKARPPSPTVLFLTSYADEPTTLAAVEAGADGHLLKSFSGQDIPQAILTEAEGGFVIDPSVARSTLKSLKQPVSDKKPDITPDDFPILTVQETRVLEIAALGRSNKQIAHELRLSEGTVRNYLSTVFGKLGVESRVEAVVLWLQRSGRQG